MAYQHMNILFYLTPKCDCAYLAEDDTLRQALEKMEARGFSSVPLISVTGQYIGTVTEGDLLWNIKNRYGLSIDLHDTERIGIMTIHRRRDYTPISISSDMDDLAELALSQNFVPVSDDDNNFIGIVTRQEIIRYLRKELDSYQDE